MSEHSYQAFVHFSSTSALSRHDPTRAGGMLMVEGCAIAGVTPRRASSHAISDNAAKHSKTTFGVIENPRP